MCLDGAGSSNPQDAAKIYRVPDLEGTSLTSAVTPTPQRPPCTGRVPRRVPRKVQPRQRPHPRYRQCRGALRLRPRGDPPSEGQGPQRSQRGVGAPFAWASRLSLRGPPSALTHAHPCRTCTHCHTLPAVDQMGSKAKLAMVMSTLASHPASICCSMLAAAPCNLLTISYAYMSHRWAPRPSWRW